MAPSQALGHLMRDIRQSNRASGATLAAFGRGVAKTGTQFSQGHPLDPPKAESNPGSNRARAVGDMLPLLHMTD